MSGRPFGGRCGMRLADPACGCRSPERRSQQPVNLLPGPAGREAVAQFELDESNEQRVERATGGQELLRYLRERFAGPDHRRQRGDLAGRPLGMPGGRGAASDRVRAAHGFT